MYSEDDYLLLSGIQHFSFCRRQWALIHVENLWNENYLTASGREAHKCVHNGDITTVRNGVITLRGLQVKSQAYGVTGVCDAVEFHRVGCEGIRLHGKDGEWIPIPVEYKYGAEKEGDFDRLQLALQAMCLEDMFSCSIDAGFLFYFQSRRRERVEITCEHRELVQSMLKEMHDYIRRGYTPKVKPTNACKQCSLADICLPMLMTKKGSVASYVERYVEEACDEENA